VLVSQAFLGGPAGQQLPFRDVGDVPGDPAPAV